MTIMISIELEYICFVQDLGWSYGWGHISHFDYMYCVRGGNLEQLHTPGQLHTLIVLDSVLPLMTIQSHSSKSCSVSRRAGMAYCLSAPSHQYIDDATIHENLKLTWCM